MEGKLDEFEKEIAGAKTLEAYIKAYRYRIENTIDASPYGVERTTEKRMLAELEKFVPKLKVTLQEFDDSYNTLVSAIVNANLKIKTLKDGLEFFESELVPDEEGHLEKQKEVVRNGINTLENEKDGYRKSIQILLERRNG